MSKKNLIIIFISIAVIIGAVISYKFFSTKNSNVIKPLGPTANIQSVTAGARAGWHTTSDNQQ